MAVEPSTQTLSTSCVPRVEGRGVSSAFADKITLAAPFFIGHTPYISEKARAAYLLGADRLFS